MTWASPQSHRQNDPPPPSLPLLEATTGFFFDRAHLWMETWKKVKKKCINAYLDSVPNFKPFWCIICPSWTKIDRDTIFGLK